MSARRKTAIADFTEGVLPLFEATRAAWLAEARAVAWGLGEGGRVVTVNDVRALCPPPEGCDPRCMGAVMRPTEWVRVGYINSNRRECHGRPLATFVRRDHAND